MTPLERQFLLGAFDDLRALRAAPEPDPASRTYSRSYAERREAAIALAAIAYRPEVWLGRLLSLDDKANTESALDDLEIDRLIRRDMPNPFTTATTPPRWFAFTPLGEEIAAAILTLEASV
jgi:hypothetical protein